MPRYPFTPELLDSIPEELAELYRSLETTLLDEICSRLNLAEQLNEVTVQDIRALRSHGISLAEIEKAIQRTSNISKRELDKLLNDVVERNQQYYREVMDLAGVTAPETLVSAADIAAIMAQAQREIGNLTRSMGFLVDNGRTMLDPARAYQWALDNAEMKVMSGAISYNQAIRSAVKQLADSGLRMVDYESGHRDHIDVAARRAVMTGVSQLCAKYTEQSAEYLETPYFEVSAHIGARDTGVLWQNHKSWQGKVYSTRAGDIYPDIYEVCGLGLVDGLEGANCRHIRHVWVEGVSERTYTDEELAHIDDGHDVTYQGKHYTAYEATQKQRQIERTVRKLKREQAAYKASGLEEDAQAVTARIRRLNKEYKAFSKAAGLPEQTERMKVRYELENTIEKPAKCDTIEKTSGGGSSVHTVGRIDIEKYKVVADKIQTDEVIITDERIEHIRERHPNDFERYAQYLSKIVENPDYILEANKPNTAFLLKEFVEADERFQLILRLAVEGDIPGYKNSIITFLKVEEKRYRRYLRTKKVLYKSE
jgi:DNA-binding transcriptional MerR regulator|nr:MAG TPA: minor capsid protein [Caudoviricetes sp.]